MSVYYTPPPPTPPPPATPSHGKEGGIRMMGDNTESWEYLAFFSHTEEILGTRELYTAFNIGDLP